MAKLTKAEVKQTITTRFTWPKPTIEFYVYLLVFAGSVVALAWRLSSLTDRLFNPYELATKHQLYLQSPWWKSLNGIYGPYYLLLHATYAINHSLFSFRLASVITGVLVVSICYLLITSWHGYKIGFLGAVIALASFGLLAAGREATPLITQLFLVAGLIFAAAILIQKPNTSRLVVFLLTLAGALYVPGGIWLAAVCSTLVFPAFKPAFIKLSKNKRALTGLIPVVLIIPLGYQLVKHYSLTQLKTWLGYGLSGKALHQLHSYFVNLGHTPADLFIRSQKLTSDISLGHLPLLPITFSLLFVLGLYCYISRLNNWRWRLVIFLLGFGWLLSGFGILSPLALLPLIAITASTGLAFLLKEWYEVFPRNPIARFTGVFVIFIVIGLSAAYAFRSYYVGWANNPDSSAIYTHQLK